MTHANARTNRILIAADSPVEGLAIESMLHGARLGTTRVTSDSREVLALYEKWPFRVLLLDSLIRPRRAAEVLSDLAPEIETRALCVLTLLPTGGDEALERYCADLVVDTMRRPLLREDVVMRTRWCLHYARTQDAS